MRKGGPTARHEEGGVLGVLRQPEFWDGAEEATKPKADPRNTLNELTGEQWLFFTRSVMSTAYPSELSHGLRKAHGANKPPRLMKELIEFFTKGGERVLDPFAGVGGTLLGAALCEPPRQAVGIEISPRWIEIYHRVMDRHRHQLAEGELLEGDCRGVLAGLPEESFDFITTDPPYNIHLERTMCDGKYDATHPNRRSDYDMRSEEAGDLANLEGYPAYLEAMQEVFAGCLRVLRPGRYLALIVRDAYQKGRYLMTHADLAVRAEAAGFVLKGDKIWYQNGARLRPYGYPFGFVPNIVHQHILIFRKERR